MIIIFLAHILEGQLYLMEDDFVIDSIQRFNFHWKHSCLIDYRNPYFILIQIDPQIKTTKSFFNKFNKKVTQQNESVHKIVIIRILGLKCSNSNLINAINL